MDLLCISLRMHDGSPEKIALHSFFAGIEGEFSGNGFMSGALAGEDALAGAALAQWGTKWNYSEENAMLNSAISNGVLSAYETKAFKYWGEVKEIAGKTMYKFLDKTGMVVWITTPVEIYSNHEAYSKSYVYVADGAVLVGIVISTGIVSSYQGNIKKTATLSGFIGGGIAAGREYFIGKFIPEKTEEERIQEKEAYDEWFNHQYELAKEGELPD